MPRVVSRFYWVLALFCLWSSPALAWQELSVRSSSAEVTFVSSTDANVRHDLEVKVRGGPVRKLLLEGDFHDIELIQDAQVHLNRKGSARTYPVALQVLESGELELSVIGQRGLREGAWIFQFGYQFDPMQKGWLVPQGDKTLVSWVGPRLFGGVDRAQVMFRVPRSGKAPESFTTDEGPETIVLSTNRLPEQDEVQLMRSYIAKGEPAVWQLLVEPDAFALAPQVSSSPGEKVLPALGRVKASPGLLQIDWWRSVTFSLGFLLLFLLKQYGASSRRGSPPLGADSAAAPPTASPHRPDRSGRNGCGRFCRAATAGVCPGVRGVGCPLGCRTVAP